MKRPSRKWPNQTRMPLGALFLLSIAIALPLAAPAADNQAKPEQPNAAGVFLPPDRELTSLINRAKQLQQQERYADAVRCLGRVLESPEDYLCPPQDLGLPPETSSYESLKGYAQRLLGQMPQQGLESYELQFGARAKQLLATGVENSDIDAIAGVSRRFFHTRAGYEATLLMALHYLEHGSPLAAAVTLEKLRPKEGPAAGRMSAIAEQFEPGFSLTLAACWQRCGERGKAEAVLRSLAEKFPRVRVGGREMGLSGDLAAVLESLEGDPVGALDLNQWAMFGGSPARNASSAGGAPLLSLCWRQPTGEPHVEGMLGQIESSFREQDRWVVPTVHPLAINDMVLMRTTKNLLAVNFVTGKRIWEVPTDDPFESAMEPPADVNYGGRQSVDFSSGLRYRMWGDATFGTLSSDGRFVFAVEDLPLEVGTSWAARHMVFINRRNNPAQAKPFNRLAAYDIKSGKLIWHAGGSPEEQNLPLAGSFFLGPPLPFGGQLYALAENKGEIRLVAMNYDDRNVRIAWTQQLTYVDTDENVMFDPIRRLSGASPSYADGVLVCPTSNNSVVALDLANRSLLWGYQYKRSLPEEQQRVGRQSQMAAEPGSRWADAAVRIADSRVLVTPVDSQYAHCLDLMTGKLLWKEPRGEDLFVACVSQGTAVFVGRSGVHAFRLERRKDGAPAAQAAAKLPPKPLAEEDDGIEPQTTDESDAGEARAAPAWDGRMVEYPNGGYPTGTGFLSEGLYYLPLSTAEVIAIDVAQGRVAHVYKSRRGFVPGNLVCHNGRILSQRADGLEVFYQRDALRKRVEQRLAANPKDPEALAQRGEILWDEGDLKGAVASFRQSLELSDNPNARTLLRESLFEGLRTDFVNYRENSDEVLRLIEEPRQQAAYLRLMAAGHENLSEYGQALEFYVKLIDLEGSENELESVAKAQSVRRDRWVRVQLASLHDSAPPEVRKRIDALAAERLEAARGQASPESLARYLDYFGDLPTAVEARKLLASRLREHGRLLHAELALRQLERSADRSQAGAALAELAAMLSEVKLHGDAAICYARLTREYGDVVCRDGQTGRQIVQSLPEDSPVALALKPSAAWPSKHVSVEKGAANERRNLAYSGTTSVTMVGRPSPFFEDMSLEWNMSPAALTGRDGWGQPRWQLSMSDAARRGYSYGPNYWRAAAQDHLLLVLMDNKLVALDTLAAGQRGAPRILWTHELDESQNDGSRRQPPQFLNPAFAGGNTSLGSTGGAFPANVPSAITEQLICYQRFQHLYGIDPVSGETVWEREDVRPDSVIFGDAERIFVIPPDNSPALVLRAADGKLLGRRELPSPTERLAPYGRHLLVWRNEGDQMLLELFDPWEKKCAWPAKRFDVQSRVAVFDGDLVGVFEQQSGQFHLFEIADGRSLIEARLDPEKTVSEMYLIQSPDNFLLVLNGLERPEESQNRSHYYGFYGVPVRQITRARLYSFGQGGKKLWPKAVTVEDQYLIMNQPVRLPVLLFARGVQATGPGNQARLALLAVDKRNGQVLNPEESLQGHGYFRVVGDPEKKTIELHLYQEIVRMTFTDRSPDPPGTAQALLRALRRTVEGGSRLPPIPTDEPQDDPKQEKR